MATIQQLLSSFNAAAPATGSLFDLIMADGATHGGIYMRLDETSGTAADDQLSANNGTYQNTPSLGNAALYPSGPLCVHTTASNQRVLYANTQMPASMPAFTIGVVYRPTALSGVRQIFSRDVDSGGRYWQWRMNGTNMEFYRTKGSIVGTVLASGMTAGNTYLITASISATGTCKLFRSGVLLGSGALGAEDYGGTTGANLTVGNRGISNEATDNYYSEAFLIFGELSEARIDQYAAAAGV